MGWDERPYYRDGGRATGGSVWSVLNGSIPLFEALGIQVRAHASFLISIGCILFLTWAHDFHWPDKFACVAILSVSVLLHELSHGFIARAMGGDADSIVIWPLGGLAPARPPRRALPTFLTAFCGPLANATVALVTGGLLYFFARWAPLNPLHPLAHRSSIPWFTNWHGAGPYLYWLFYINYLLAMVNLLPILPFDGGQMTQAILWPYLGFFRSMMFAMMIGMIGASLFFVVGLAWLNPLLITLALFAFLACFQQRQILRESGPAETWQSESVDYSASVFHAEPRPKRKHLSRRAIKRARKIVHQEIAERQRIDAILAKVSAGGMGSLNWFERRALHKTTERKRKRDLELLLLERPPDANS